MENKIYTLPSRDFVFILDPNCLNKCIRPPNIYIFSQTQKLRDTETNVNIDILSPIGFKDSSINSPDRAIMTTLKIKDIETNDAENAISIFELDSFGDKNMEADFNKEDKETKLALSLLALSNHKKADAIITNDAKLIKYKYSIYRNHRIRITEFDKFYDLFEIICHGFSAFWSALTNQTQCVFDLFYTDIHPKNSHYSKFFQRNIHKIENEDLRDNLRTMVFQRLPFILYSRDMVKFFELQRDWHFRRGLLKRFGLILGYYLSTFYFFLWGMLDQLALITKYALDLNLSEKNCGIRKKKFKEQLQNKEPELWESIRKTSVEWINQMADFRHLASHGIIPIPTELYVETKESKKSEEEIWDIILKEEPALKEMLTITLFMKQELIFHWRVKHMRCLIPSFVKFKNKQGTYLRDYVGSVDHDLNQLELLTKEFFDVLIKKYLVPNL